MRKAGLSELSNTNMLVVLLIMGLIFLSQTLDQQIQKLAELLSQVEAMKPIGFYLEPSNNQTIRSERANAHDN